MLVLWLWIVLGDRVASVMYCTVVWLFLLVVCFVWLGFCYCIELVMLVSIVRGIVVFGGVRNQSSCLVVILLVS